MTKPSDEALENEKDKLFVTEAELIRRLGVPEKIGRAAIHVLDRTRNTGFPPKIAVWGDRRYWPAVKAWFDRTYGQGSTGPRVELQQAQPSLVNNPANERTPYRGGRVRVRTP